MPPAVIETTTPPLPMVCSPTELRRQDNLKKDYKIVFVKIKKKEYKHYLKKDKKDILALKLRENLIRRKKSKK